MARSRILTCSGRYQEDGNDTYKLFSKRAWYSTTAFGNSATLNAGVFSSGFEEDTSYSGGTWGTPGSTKRWRAWVETYCDRTSTNWAGSVASTRDTQRVYSDYYVYTYPNSPTTTGPALSTTVTQNAYVDWSASMTLAEHWEDDTTSPVGQRAPTAAKPWDLCSSATITINGVCTQTATLSFLDDTGTTQTLTQNYNYAWAYTVTSSPNKYFNTYSCAVSAQVPGNNTLSWSATASGSGIEWPSGDTGSKSNFTGSGTSGSGSGTITGTPLSGSLQNNNAGGGYFSTCSVTYSPNRCTGADAQVNRYQDAAGYAGMGLLWTSGGADPGQSGTTDSGGYASGFQYPYDGSKLEYKNTLVNGQTLVFSNPTVPSHALTIDATWADANGLYLMEGGLGYQSGVLQAKVYKEFPIGTWQQDDSHSYDQFSSLAHWSAGGGSGAFSLDLGGIKLAPTAVPYTVATNDTIKQLNCWAYRYFKVTVRADVAGAQIKVGLGSRNGAATVAYAYWTITVTAANTWEDHEIDIALPESDSAGTSPMNYINHPDAYFSAKGSMSLTALTSGANVWVKGFTGFLKQDGSRIPVLLLHDLNSNSADDFGTNDQLRQFKGTVFTETVDSVERSPGSLSTPIYARGGVGQGTQWGRIIVNGVVGADIRPSGTGTTRVLLSASNAGYTSSCANFWKNLKTLADDAANDTGVHIAEAGSAAEILDTYTRDWKRTALWSRLNDTPGSPVTLSVACVPSNLAINPNSVPPGCGDYYNGGAYGVRLVTHYHDWRGGEVMGCLEGGAARKPIRGRSVAVERHPSGTAIGSTTSNDDGFWRVFTPYGVPRPYSNNPGGAGTSGSPHYLQQFTGTASSPTGYPNTSPGNNFAPFVLRSTAFRSKDGSNYATRPDGSTYAGTVRELVASWDRYGSYYGFGDALPPSAVGIDLARDHRNWLYRSYVASGVTVGRLFYGGSWSDVAVATDHDSTAIPTLLVDRRGTVLVFYHDASGHGRLWWSQNAGVTWSDRGTLSGVGTFPRATLLPNDTLLVVSCAGGGLAIHQSTDWQTAASPTMSSIATFGSLPEQLADLHCDRNGDVHLVCMDGTSVLHTYGPDGATWATATTLATGDHAAYALGIERAILARWNGSSPHLELTDETYGALPGLPAFDVSALSGLETQYLGAVWEAGQRLIIAGLDSSGIPVLWYSPERHSLSAL